MEVMKITSAFLVLEKQVFFLSFLFFIAYSKKEKEITPPLMHSEKMERERVIYALPATPLFRSEHCFSHLRYTLKKKRKKKVPLVNSTRRYPADISRSPSLSLSPSEKKKKKKTHYKTCIKTVGVYHTADTICSPSFPVIKSTLSRDKPVKKKPRKKKGTVIAFCNFNNNFFFD